MAKSKPWKTGSEEVGTGCVENELSTTPLKYDRNLARLFENSVCNPTSTINVLTNDTLAGTHETHYQWFLSNGSGT